MKSSIFFVPWCFILSLTVDLDIGRQPIVSALPPRVWLHRGYDLTAKNLYQSANLNKNWVPVSVCFYSTGTSFKRKSLERNAGGLQYIPSCISRTRE